MHDAAMTHFDRDRVRQHMLDRVCTALRPVEQVQAMEDAVARALQSQDHQAFEQLLADDSAMLIRKQMLRGKEEIIAALRACFDESQAPVCCECLQIEVLGNGLVAFTNGALLDPTDASAVGAFESIWRYDHDAQWRLIFAQASFARTVVGGEWTETDVQLTPAHQSAV